MKKIKYLLIYVLAGCFIFSNSAYANNGLEIKQKTEKSFITRDSILLPNTTISNNYAIVTRGQYIASSGLSISNEGYGVLGVYADTLAHVPVKKIKMTIYIDCWDEEDEDWYQVSYKALEYEYEEGGNDLTAASEFFNVENLETNKYYRLRGLHAAWSFDGYIETHGTMTDGILLTDGPA